MDRAESQVNEARPETQAPQAMPWRAPEVNPAREATPANRAQPAPWVSPAPLYADAPAHEVLRVMQESKVQPAIPALAVKVPKALPARQVHKARQVTPEALADPVLAAPRWKVQPVPPVDQAPWDHKALLAPPVLRGELLPESPDRLVRQGHEVHRVRRERPARKAASVSSIAGLPTGTSGSPTKVRRSRIQSETSFRKSQLTLIGTHHSKSLSMEPIPTTRV